MYLPHAPSPRADVFCNCSTVPKSGVHHCCIHNTLFQPFCFFLLMALHFWYLWLYVNPVAVKAHHYVTKLPCCVTTHTLLLSLISANTNTQEKNTLLIHSENRSRICFLQLFLAKVSSVGADWSTWGWCEHCTLADTSSHLRCVPSLTTTVPLEYSQYGV